MTTACGVKDTHQNICGAVFGVRLNEQGPTIGDEVIQIFLHSANGFSTSGIIKAGTRISLGNVANCVQFNTREWTLIVDM